jgi:tRNA-dihydrouridine synthase B
MTRSECSLDGASQPPQPWRVGPVGLDPPLLMAPMAGFTNYAFRQVVRRLGGVGLLATEMVRAHSLVGIASRSGKIPGRLWGVADEPRPLAVQLWDNDPGLLAEAGARLAHEWNVSVIDINFGCPAKQVSLKARSGAYLLQWPDRVGAMVERVVRACRPTPVTAKIRLGPSLKSINAVEVAQAIEAGGAAAVTVHGRTAADMFRGEADWDRIAQIKPHLRRIPLIGNGDLKTPGSVVEAFSKYGVDGVMIGRAALGRPWLFRQAQAALGGKAVPADLSVDQQRELLLDHYQFLLERFGERLAAILVRKCACRYGQGCPGTRAFRVKVANVATSEEFRAVVEEHFPRDAVVDG